MNHFCDSSFPQLLLWYSLPCMDDPSLDMLDLLQLYSQLSKKVARSMVDDYKAFLVEEKHDFEAPYELMNN